MLLHKHGCCYLKIDVAVLFSKRDYFIEGNAGNRAEHHTKLFKQGLLPNLTLFGAKHQHLTGESDSALDPGAATTTELQQLKQR